MRPEATLPSKTPQNSSANVVPFSRENVKDSECLSDAQITLRLKRLPKPVQTIKQRAEAWLTDHLDSVLAKVDDALFELASNAQKQSEQDDYFFAMRELRNNHQELLTTFRREVSQLFVACVDEFEADAPTFDSLAVIANEEFDEILAVEATIKRSEIENKHALTALAKRLAAICEYDESIRAIPISPSSVCKSLKAATAFLRLSPNARLVLFKLFEQGVICHVAELYSVANKYLAECGILPDLHSHLAQANQHRSTRKKSKILKSEDDGLTAAVVTLDENDLALTGDNKNTQTSRIVKPKPNTAQTYDRSAQSSGNSLSASDQTADSHIKHLTQKIHSLQQLINGNISFDPQGENSVLGGSPYNNPEVNSPEANSSAASHSAMKSSSINSSSINSSKNSAEGFHQNVQQLLGLLADLQNKASTASLARPNSLNQLLGRGSDSLNGANLAGLFPQSPERKTLQVVDGLFGSMLTKQGLSNPLKELLVRLQIPLARAAVVDPDILNNPDHSARQLINALAKAGLAWHGDDVSTLHKDPLYQKMQKIVDRAANEYSNDNQLFTDLVADLNSFTQREQKRLALLEKRMLDAEQGRAKAETARVAVAHTLGESCRNVQVDGVLNEFIHKAWQQVLYVTYLKYGEQSSQWHAAVKPLTDLMASLENISDFMGCEHARKKSEVLIKIFKQGLDEISFDAFEAERLLSRVAGWYQKLKPSVGSSNKSLHASETQKNKIAAKASTIDSDSTINKPAVVACDQAESDDAINDIYYDQARALQRGTWVDYCKQDKPVLRCRLAAVIESTSSHNCVSQYIFVDRQGHKALELSLLAVALAFKSQTLTAIDDGQLFDRALEQVIVSLRKKGTD